MEPSKKKTRGGARPGGGRPLLEPGSETVTFPVKMSMRQRDKLKLLGGAPWVRSKIDKAKLPDK